MKQQLFMVEGKEVPQITVINNHRQSATPRPALSSREGKFLTCFQFSKKKHYSGRKHKVEQQAKTQASDDFAKAKPLNLFQANAACMTAQNLSFNTLC